VHAPLAVKILNRCSHVFSRKLFHNFFQCRLLLAYDLIQLCGMHSGFLQLVIGSSGFDRFMLANVAH
jgi:hypothetical protein